MTHPALDHPDIQPYYAAYLLAHGRPVNADGLEAQRAHDRRQAPGAPGGPYMRWISAQWAAWRAEQGLPEHRPVSEDQRDAFEAWLAARVTTPAAA